MDVWARTLSTGTWTTSPPPRGRRWCGRSTRAGPGRPTRCGGRPSRRCRGTCSCRTTTSASAGGYERRWGESPDPRTRERWLRGAYADAPLATRLRDGELVSSSSQPSLMAMMLAELRVRGRRPGPGDRRRHRLQRGAARPPARRRRPGHHRRPGAGDHRGGPPAPGRPPGTTPWSSPATARAGCPNAPPSTGSSRPAPCRRSRPPGSPSAAPARRILTPLATGLIALTVRDAGHGGGALPAHARLLRAAARRRARAGAAAELGGVPRRARDHELFRFLLALTRGSLDPQEALRAVGARGAAAARAVRHHGQRRRGSGPGWTIRRGRTPGPSR